VNTHFLRKYGMGLIAMLIVFMSVSACCCGGNNKTTAECQAELDNAVSIMNQNYSSKSSISLTKTASPATFKRAGDVISYTYVLTNTGNYDFNETVNVSDDKINLTCPAVTNLKIGASITCNGSYTITTADVTAGQVVNNASAQASQETEYQCIVGGVGGTTMRKTASFTANASASATVTLDVHPALTLSKSPDPAFYSGWVWVTYTYTLTNSGDVPLTGPFTVTDSRIKNILCPAMAELAPGASLQCTATYLIDAGLRWTITNTATGYGQYFGQTIISNTTSAAVQFVQPTPRPAPRFYCGDGIVTPPEQCDPPDGIYCSTSCLWIDE
jgi:uncharacterized repeat protein (TIGR01451 family)